MRLSDYQVETGIGQTPCLCGSFETWHPSCYVGKTPEQIAERHIELMRLGRKELERRVGATVDALLERAREA